MSRMNDFYKEKVAKELMTEFGYKNVHQIPKISKVVINAGVGRASADTKQLEPVIAGLTKIAGQAPVVNKARKSIAGFKIREGMNIGASVTLRGERMFEFLDRLVNVALPRVRDFRGIKGTAFDGNGNYSLGIKEYGVFPEISFEEAVNTFGLQVNVTTTAKTDAEGKALLTKLGFPFKD
jgi:large subunit ribosomal protein L5